MPEAKPFASLSSGLLARKGAARPAMRPQLPMSYEEQQRAMFGTVVSAEPPIGQDDLGQEDLGQEDLGWNDMGEDVDAGVSPISADVAPVVRAEQPEVLRRIEALMDSFSAAVPAPSRRKGSALKDGRKAALTLRLDAERHLRLRLASTLGNRSAQQLLVEALDRLLDGVPGLDDLARSARRPS